MKLVTIFLFTIDVYCLISLVVLIDFCLDFRILNLFWFNLWTKTFHTHIIIQTINLPLTKCLFFEIFLWMVIDRIYIYPTNVIIRPSSILVYFYRILRFILSSLHSTTFAQCNHNLSFIIIWLQYLFVS